MAWWSNIFKRNQPKPKGKRSLDAAQTGRVYNGWGTSRTSIDYDLRTGLAVARQRSRDAITNDPWARRYLKLLQQNVLNDQRSGFKFTNHAQEEQNGEIKIDTFANRFIESQWARFIQPEYLTMTSRVGLRDLLKMAISHLVSDGEVFVHVEIDSSSPFGFRLNMIEPDYIDETYNEQTQSGYIRLGIEVNEYGKPVAYWMRKRTVADQTASMPGSYGERIRIPAESMIHVYDPMRANQTRGVPWLAPGLFVLHQLKEWNEAVLFNARYSASKMGFYTKSADAAGGVNYDEEDSDRNKIQELEPGAIEELPAGTSFVGFDPKFPMEGHEAFQKSQLRQLASGWGISYNSMGNDAESINYSSLRQFKLEDYEAFKDVQILLVNQLLIPIYNHFLEMLLLSPINTIRLPYAKKDKFNAPRFTGRRWPWVDPAKDVRARVDELTANLTTLEQVYAEQGQDWKESIDQIAREKEYMESLGLKPNESDPSVPIPQDEEETDE